MKNRVELRTYIRFQLAQLGVRNGHHEFELLCFELARLRHVSNLQPATGPVAAGGDQGKDFESYRTFLTESPIAKSSFTAMAATELVVGACTLDKKIEAKVRRDLKVIFGSPVSPHRVLYYCERDVPVAKRHKLQDHCRNSYHAELELFDGQAISDQLADNDTFWITEQFLSVPSDFYPLQSVDDEYDAIRASWLVPSKKGGNYADFLEIKVGLRTATREEKARPDLLRWLALMRAFTSRKFPIRLQQKARYEIAVAELRGRGNLDPAIGDVATFFDNVVADVDHPSDLLDASVLAVYCFAAVGLRQTTLSLERAQRWAQCARQAVDQSIARATRRGDHCTLLEAQAMLAAIPDEDAAPDETFERSLKAWRKVVASASDVPFFPIAHISDLVEKLAPLAADRSTFRQLRDDVDSITDRRAGKHEVAERSLKRALAQLKAGNRLSAIDELQRAKVGWFTGDAMPDSIRAMLVLSQCYSELGLHLAARYYAAGAAYIALNSDNDQISGLLPRAASALADTFYRAGEGLTYLLSLKQVIGVHFALMKNAGDLEKHPELTRLLVHAAIFRVVARRLGPQLTPTIEQAIASWQIPKAQVDALFGLADASESPWTKMTPKEIENAIERDIGYSPFNDIGMPREVVWSALGIRWIVRYSADRATIVAAQALIATLQLALVELASSELLVIPAEALIRVETGDVDRPDVVQLPDNKTLSWKVILPRQQDEGKDLNLQVAESLSVVMAVIGQSTALDAEAFFKIIRDSFERGLGLRVFSVRPAREMMEFSLNQAEGTDKLKSLAPVQLSRSLNAREVQDLAWRSDPGPGYSRQRAEEFLANRYRRSMEIIRFSLPRILSDDRCRILLQGLRSRGYLDWQILAILAAMVIQFQVEKATGQPLRNNMAEYKVRASRPETERDAIFDLHEINESRLAAQEAGLLSATFVTWGLAHNSSTPNHAGMKRLLDARYRHSTDDIPHPDPFFIPDTKAAKQS